MSKKILTLTMAVALMLGLSACGTTPKSEKDRLKEATVEISCDVIKPTLAMLQDAMANQDSTTDFEAKSKELETQMQDILKKYGFEDETAFEEAAKKYEEDADFTKEVEDAVKEKCDFSADDMGM